MVDVEPQSLIEALWDLTSAPIMPQIQARH